MKCEIRKVNKKSWSQDESSIDSKGSLRQKIGHVPCIRRRPAAIATPKAGSGLSLTLVNPSAKMCMNYHENKKSILNCKKTKKLFLKSILNSKISG